ncbi:histidinol-phosphate transaminase [Candidatus Omnitrophota bacterium]
MNKLFRKNINKLKAYIPGKPIDLVQRQFGIKNAIKLGSNENAFGAPSKAKLAIKKGLNEIFRYPDGSCYYLRRALAKRLKVQPGNLIFGNGSDEVIDIIIKTFLNPGEEVLTSKTTFVEYEIIAKTNGFKAKCLPLKDFKYDLAALRKAVSKKTKAIFIANPNNPTGTYNNSRELLKLINSLPKDKLVVVDEAYLEFVDAKDYPKTAKLINKRNLIILRTFSKAYGLAGLRVGYAITKPKFIEAMERIRQPFNVNSLAQCAALAALNDSSFMTKTTKILKKEKYKLYKEFQEMGISYIPSQANFIMFKTKMDGLILCKKLLKTGIIIRDLKQYKLDNYVRVTVGKPSENKLFVKKLKEVISGG